MSESKTSRRIRGRAIVHLVLWLAAFAALLVATNAGFLQRIELLAGQARWVALLGYVGVWGFCVAALFLAAMQPNPWLRGAWGLLFALSAAAGSGFRHVSGSDLGVFEMVSLWAARHEAGRAADFYAGALAWPVLVILSTLVLAAFAPVPRSPFLRRWTARLGFVPLLPVLAIAGIVFIKEGGGSQALPVQVAPVSVGLVTASKIAANPLPEREPVVMEAGEGGIRNIVVLVDESIRGDFVDFTPGNAITPHLAENRGRIVDFGPAVSGGTCSHYSNAILRYAARRDDLGGPAILRDPTIWQYAHAAGYETVFIDAQSAFNKNPGKLQNFMTTGEAASIDRFYTMDETVPTPELDRRLLDILGEELASDTPKLIFADKNGAHFPYDSAYPEAERVFTPTMGATGANTSETRTQSYRNAVRWNVDLFFERLLRDEDLKDTVVIYTSDHGQVFDPDALSHCSVDDPDPREGLVPLFVVTGDEALRARFSAAARASGPRTHFSIMPTALHLLGYPHEAIVADRGPTLLDVADEPLAFSSGDIFGLFSSDVRWHEVDLDRLPLTPEHQPVRAAPKPGPDRVAANGAG